jgi:cytidylate kinase
MIIAIDGPAGSGKSTVAKLLAKKLGFLYLDTGAMYRALTLKILNLGIDPRNEKQVTGIAEKTKIDLVNSTNGPIQVLLDNIDVSVAIREPKVTKHVSDIAKIKEVRDIMVTLQRKMGQVKKNCILDGRDIGTVVFPQADKKFFVDASFDERVNRRFKDLQNMNIMGVSREQVAADLKNRDTIDSTREHAPLIKADDAVYVDTTNINIEQVVQILLENIKKKNH